MKFAGFKRSDPGPRKSVSESQKWKNTKETHFLPKVVQLSVTYSTIQW